MLEGESLQPGRNVECESLRLRGVRQNRKSYPLPEFHRSCLIWLEQYRCLNCLTADVVVWSVGFDRSSGTDRKAIWIDGLRRLLNALPARAEPRRILYTSSTSVYGDGYGQDVDENTEPNPTSEGGLACLAAEHLLRDYSMRSSACVSILRLAGIYGPNRLLRRIADLQHGVPIMSPPDEWLNLIHVDDAVTAIDCVSQLEWPPSLMNVVAGESSTRRQYYSQLAAIANAPPPDVRRSAPSRRIFAVVAIGGSSAWFVNRCPSRTNTIRSWKASGMRCSSSTVDLDTQDLRDGREAGKVVISEVISRGSLSR